LSDQSGEFRLAPACGVIKKSTGDPKGARGRLISSSNRQRAVELIEEAHINGARYEKACEVLTISIGIFQRWKNNEESLIDKPKGSHLDKPIHALVGRRSF
jgi:hypothetical protein